MLESQIATCADEDEMSNLEVMLRENNKEIGSQRATLDHDNIIDAQIDTEEGINVMHAIPL